MIEVLSHRFKQVSLKGKQFQFANAASNEEVGKAEDVVITKIFMVFLKSIVDIIHFKSVIRRCKLLFSDGKLTCLPDPS